MNMKKELFRTFKRLDIGVEQRGPHYLLDFMANEPAYDFKFWLKFSADETFFRFTVEFAPKWDWDETEENREALCEMMKNHNREEHVLFVKNDGLHIVSSSYTEPEEYHNFQLFRFRDEALRMIGTAVKELKLFKQEHECSSKKHGHECLASSGICESITHGYGRAPTVTGNVPATPAPEEVKPIPPSLACSCQA
jgi:hypothetical protein